MKAEEYLKSKGYNLGALSCNDNSYTVSSISVPKLLEDYANQRVIEELTELRFLMTSLEDRDTIISRIEELKQD